MWAMAKMSPSRMGIQLPYNAVDSTIRRNPIANIPLNPMILLNGLIFNVILISVSDVFTYCCTIPLCFSLVYLLDEPIIKLKRKTLGNRRKKKGKERAATT